MSSDPQRPRSIFKIFREKHRQIRRGYIYPSRHRSSASTGRWPAANLQEHPLSKPSPPSLLSVRTALILLLGVLCGAAVTTLAALAERNLTGAVLAGLAAAGGTIVFFHKVIGPDTHVR
jgi:hypothetical protein